MFFFISSFFDPPVRPGSSSVCQPLGDTRWEATIGRMCTQWDPRWALPLMFLLTLRVFFLCFFLIDGSPGNVETVCFA